MNSSVKSKIEKFIDSHGSELVLKVQRKKKPAKGKSTESPSSVISEKMTPVDVDISSSPAIKNELPQDPPPSTTASTTTAAATTKPASPNMDTIEKPKDDFYYRRNRSPYRYEYVRPGYTRPPYYNNYYRYPRPPSPYYRNNRYRRSPPPFYRQNSSRRGSLSDDEMDRRRWD
jgi:hypothetical protein